MNTVREESKAGVRMSLFTEQEIKALEDSRKRINSTRIRTKDLKDKSIYFVVEYYELPQCTTKKKYFQKLEDALFCYKFYKENWSSGIEDLKLYKEFSKRYLNGLIKEIL